jgi:anti-sigma regulatory factor (Ser/Thr protein kinase)
MTAILMERRRRATVVPPRPERVCRLELASEPSAVRWARRHAADVLAAWGLTELSDTVLLVVSELVTNSVRHARVPPGRAVAYGDLARVYRIGLTLVLLPDALVIEVHDPDPAPPVLRDTGPEAEGGRGLVLVTALCRRANYYLIPGGGKATWAEIEREHPCR